MCFEINLLSAILSTTGSNLHLFKDKFDGDEFSKWLHSIVENTSKAVDQHVFDSVLQFVTHQSVGVLYDETVKSFCILGKDQEMLVQMNERPLDQPTVIYGLAGTGKTISIMARIQQQHVLNKLTKYSKAIYLTSEENAIKLVKRQLEACNIDLTHITLAKFAAFHNLCDINLLFKVIKELISDGYRYICCS